MRQFFLVADYRANGAECFRFSVVKDGNDVDDGAFFPPRLFERDAELNAWKNLFQRAESLVLLKCEIHVQIEDIMIGYRAHIYRTFVETGNEGFDMVDIASCKLDVASVPRFGACGGMEVEVNPRRGANDLLIDCCHREHLARFSWRYCKYYSQIVRNGEIIEGVAKILP